MKIEKAELNVLVLTFEREEREYLEREATENDLTIMQMIEELFGMVFSGGYEFIS